jgi:hypothetical protein
LFFAENLPKDVQEALQNCIRFNSVSDAATSSSVFPGKKLHIFISVITIIFNSLLFVLLRRQFLIAKKVTRHR